MFGEINGREGEHMNEWGGGGTAEWGTLDDDYVSEPSLQPRLPSRMTGRPEEAAG